MFFIKNITYNDSLFLQVIWRAKSKFSNSSAAVFLTRIFFLFSRGGKLQN